MRTPFYAGGNFLPYVLILAAVAVFTVGAVNSQGKSGSTETGVGNGVGTFFSM